MQRLTFGLLGLIIAAAAFGACAADMGAETVIGTGGAGTWSSTTGGAPSGGWSDLPGGPSASSDGGQEFGGGAGGASPTTGTSTDQLTGGNAPAPVCNWGQAPPLTLMETQPGALRSGPFARARVRGGKLPVMGSVTPGELLAYYRIDYPEAPGQTKVYAEIERSKVSGEYVLQVAVRTPSVQRPPMAVAVVLDTSVSMLGGAWDRARAAAAAAVGGLRPGDELLVVTAGRQVVRAGHLDDQGAVEAASAAAEATAFDAGEDLAGAVEDAYTFIDDKRSELFLPPEQLPGRVVVVTDGAAAPTSLPLDRIAGGRAAGVLFTGVGVGDPSSYDSTMLALASYNGGGAHLYVDDEAEATATLKGRFDELFTVCQESVKVTVTLPPNVREQTLVPLPAPSEGQAVEIVGSGVGCGRSLVFRRTLETCLTKEDLDGSSIRVTATGLSGTLDTVEKSIAELHPTDQGPLARGAAIAAYAEALAHIRPGPFQSAVDLANAALAIYPNDHDLLEIVELATKARELSGVDPATN